MEQGERRQEFQPDDILTLAHPNLVFCIRGLSRVAAVAFRADRPHGEHGSARAESVQRFQPFVGFCIFDGGDDCAVT